MSKNRSKAKPIRSGPQSSRDDNGPSESPEWLEMTENAGENEIIGSRPSPNCPDSSSDPSGSPESPEWLEMTENAGENKKSGLSFRQESALPAIAAAPSIAQAARDARISERTLRRWLDDEDFREEVINLRQESAQLARQELQGLMLTGLSVLASAMQSPDEPTRIRAARYVVSFGIQIGEAEQLRREVRNLEDAFALLSARKPVH